MSRRWIYSVILIILTTVLLGCAPTGQAPALDTVATPVSEAPGEGTSAATEPAQETEMEEKRLVVAQGADAVTLDAGMTTGTTTANVVSNIYDPLVIRDDNMSIIPGLAVSWEPLDETTWRFKLREGVSFHNGEPFDAEAVKFSLERVIDPDQGAPQASYINTIARVEIVDDYTVDIITAQPDPILIARLAKAVASIMPPKYVQENGDEFVALNPVGTGPFKFVEWVKDDRIVLEANQDYWRDPPQYDTLVFRPIPNLSTRTSALIAGDVDLIYNAPVSQAELIAEGPNTKLVSVDIQAGEYIGFNLRKEDSPLQDVRVRRALNYAVDVNAIIEGVLEGYATRRASPVTPLDFGYVELEPYPYDPEQAKELLAEAGYPNGEGLSLKFDSPQGRYPMDRQVSEVVAGQLRDMGIDIDFQVHEWGSYLDLFKTDEIGDLYLLGWGSITTLDADAALYDELHCGKRYSTYCNEELDAILEEARSIIDPDKRQALYEQAQRMILENPPWIFMYQERQLYGMNEKVEWEPRADSILDLYRVVVR